MKFQKKKLLLVSILIVAAYCLFNILEASVLEKNEGFLDYVSKTTDAISFYGNWVVTSAVMLFLGIMCIVLFIVFYFLVKGNEIPLSNFLIHKEQTWIDFVKVTGYIFIVANIYYFVKSHMSFPRFYIYEYLTLFSKLALNATFVIWIITSVDTRRRQTNIVKKNKVRFKS